MTHSRLSMLAALPLLLIACQETQETEPAPSKDQFWLSKAPCVSVGAETKVLFRSEEMVDVQYIVPDGDSLLYTTHHVAEEGRPPLHALRRVSIASAESRPIVTSELPLDMTPIADFEGRALYRRMAVTSSPEAGGGVSLTFGPSDLVLRDRATGADTTIPRPAGGEEIGSVLTTKNGIVWVSIAKDGDHAVRSIVRWDPDTQTTTELFKDAVGAVTMAEGLAADEDAVFFVTHDGADASTSRLEAINQTDRARRVVATKAAPIKVLGVDDESVFYAEGLVDTLVARDVMAMSKDGKKDALLAADANVVLGFTMGPSSLYWIDYRNANTIVSVPRQGGPVARITHDAMIWHVAADRCNVYWSADGETKISARGH